LKSQAPNRLEELVDKARSGDIRATGRLLSVLERLDSDAMRLLAELQKTAGRAHVIGITGIPGAGKSTLIGRLIQELRRRGYRVAVVAIDPSSPISSGSLLGDRLRMQEYAGDPGVFIRSISTRGLKGGLSMAALAMIEAFDALGYDFVIVETVGVGQAEVDIASAAHTIVVVTMPGAGDDIQALKAGVMEIGDIYVVNKSDKPEAAKTYEFIVFSVEKGDLSASSGWRPRVIMVSAVMGKNIDKLVDAIIEHREYLENSGLFKRRIEERRRLLSKYTVLALLSEAIEESSRAIEGLDEKSIEEAAREILLRACRMVGGE